MSRAAYCNRCGRRYEKRRVFGCSCDECETYECQVDAQYFAVDLAVFAATTEAFWSGVRACMLVEARTAYLEEARAAWWALDTGREIYEEDTGPFWLAVAALQRLGEVGGSPWPGGEP